MLHQVIQILDKILPAERDVLFIWFGTFAAMLLFVWKVAALGEHGPVSEDEGEEKRIPWIYRIAGMGSFSTLGALVENVLPRLAEKVQKDLARASIPIMAKQVFAAQLFWGISGVIAGVIVSIFLPSGTSVILPFTISIFFGLAGVIYPLMHVQKLAEKRTGRILKALPFVIDLLSSSMNAGLDFTAAVRYLLSIGDTKNPLIREFRVLLQSIELGRSRSDALRDMDLRIGVPEFSRFASAVVYGMDTGSSIVNIIRIQSAEMRRLQFMRAEQQASKVPAKMVFPMLIFIFPAMFIIIIVPLVLRLQRMGAGGMFR
mgnify:CR=1 FL=1